MKHKTDENRQTFVKQHNYCVSLLTKSKRNYYSNLNLRDFTDNKKFWKTIKQNLIKKICCLFHIKVACRVQIWQKTFSQNSDKFSYSFIKNEIMFIYLLCIYKKPIILSLFKIDVLNFTMYTVTILTCLLKTYVIRLHNLISMNIFFILKNHSFSL